MSAAQLHQAAQLRWVLLFAVSIVLPFGNVFAADPATAPPTIRRLFVPESSPQRWPAGDWRPWRLTEFEQRMAALQPAAPQPDRAVITQGKYRAVLADDHLRGGQFEFKVQRTGKDAATLLLDPWNLPVTSLNWKEGAAAALWGADPLGRSLLVVDRPAGTVVGTWTLAGRKLPQGREFSLQFPPTSATRLELQLPTDRILQCSQGDVTGPIAAAEPGWSLWQVELGSRSRAQVLITHRPGPRPAPGTAAAAPLPRPLVIARREMVCAIRQEAMRMQADFHLEVLESPVRELRFIPSSELKVISIALGDNTPLPWSEMIGPEGRQLKVTLPDPLEGPGIVIRVQALATPLIQQNWPLSELRLADAVPIDGQVTINVAPPLELDDFQFPIDSYRQTALVTSPTEGESIVLRQLQPTGDARLLLAWPRWTARCRMLTQVQATGREWTSNTQFEWSAASGSSFSVRCALPPNWTVVDVREPENEQAGSVISWELIQPATPKNPVILRVEFREALVPEHPRKVRVLCRAPAAGLRTSVAVPVFVPQGPQDLPLSDAESFISISTEATASPVLEKGEQLAVATAGDFPSDSAAEQFWQTAPVGAYPGGLLLKSRNAAAAHGQFLLQSARDLADVQASVLAVVNRQRIVEKFRLRVTPRNAPLKRVLVYLTEAGSEAEPVEWSLAEEQQQRLESHRLDAASHLAWNVPETGALWEVRLPVALEGEFTLLGRRTRPLKSPDRVTLLHVPHANMFEARVEVERNPQLLLQLEPRNLEAFAESSDDPSRRPAAAGARREVWRYRDLTAELDLRVAQDRETAAPLVVSDLDVTARLSLETQGNDLYWASFRMTGVSETSAPTSPLRWILPADAVLLQVTRDGTRLIPEQSGAQYLVFPSERRRAHVVQIQYRVPTNVVFGPNRRTLALPETPHSILRFNLKLLVPESARLDGSLSNLRFAEPTEAPASWRQTLFGPWGRPAGTKPFNPTAWDHWSANWPLLGGSADDSSPIDPANLDSIDSVSGSDAASSASAGMPTSAIIPGDAASRGWRIWRYTAPVPPSEIQLVLWDRSQVWHFCWILLLLTLITGSLVRARRGAAKPSKSNLLSHGKWITALVCVVAFLGASVPGIAFELVASICLGIVVAALLPQRWLDRRLSTASETPRVPGGSTRSFAQPTGFLSAGVIALITGIALATEATPNGLDENSFDVLIPVDSQGKPAGKDPLVYVPPNLHERLLLASAGSQALPDSLITSAEYIGAVESERPFIVNAKYEVAVLSRMPEVRVPFEFRGGNLGGEGACLVDGKPHPVFPNGTGDGCLLALPGVSLDASAKSTVSSPADGISVRRFQVEFRLHPQVVSRAAKGIVRTSSMGVPRLLSSVVSISSAKPFPWLIVQQADTMAPTESPAGSPGSARKALLGRASDLTWQWSDQLQPAAAAAEMQWRFSTVVDVDPRLLQFRCQANGKVQQGTLSSVKWLLPAGTAVRLLQATDLLEYHLDTQPDGTRLLWITFNRPRTGEISIQAVLVHPIESKQGRLSIPRLSIPECGDAPAAAGNVVLNQMALRPPADFRMESPLPSRPDKFQLLSSEEFQRVQPVDGARRITEAWQLQEPQEISIKLEVLRPRLNVSSSTIYRVLRDRIDITWEADIDTSTAPGFRYRLQSDPRLQISSISVMEEGVERLLRWNPAPGNQALVFLNDSTTRAQKLLLEGHFPLTGPGTIDLPQVQLVYADVKQSRISVYHDAGWNVQLKNADRFQILPTDPAEHSPYGREIALGRYQLPAGTSPGSAVIAKNEPAIKADRLFLLNTQEKPWKLTSILRLQVDRGRGAEFEVIVPREWSPVAEVHSQPAGRHVATTLKDGAQHLLISPEEPLTEGASCTITLRLPVIPRSGLSWVLPDIQVPGSSAGSSFILTHSRGPAVKVSGQRFEKLDAASLSAAIRVLVPESPTGTEWLWSPTGSAPVRLQFPTAAASSARLRRVILSETQIIPTPNGMFGRQLLWLPPDSAEQLDFEWPEELDLTAVLVDGSVVTVSPPQGGRLSIPLHPGGAGQTLLLAWKASSLRADNSESASPWGMSGELKVLLPRLRDSVIETTLLEVLPTGKLRLRSEDNRPATSAVWLALERWEGLLRWQAAQLTENVSDEQIEATDQFIQRTAIDTERLLRRESTRGIEDARLRQRFEELRKQPRDFLPDPAFSEFQRPTLVLPVPLEPLPQLNASWTPSRVSQGTFRLIQEAGEDATPDEKGEPATANSSAATLKILYATGGAFPWLLGLIAAGLLGWLTVWLRRWRLLERLQTRTWLACVVLGLLWWQVLLGGGWGFILLIGGLVTGMISLFRRQAPPRRSETASA